MAEPPRYVPQTDETDKVKQNVAIQQLYQAVTDTASNALQVANNLSDVASASTARTNLGLAIGTNVQAHSANLDTLAALGNWKVAYTNGSGIQTALGVGAAGTALGGNGVSAAPSFQTISALLNGQIAFPATQNPSSDPNTLDDYEEGTWTPTLLFGGASTGITYSNQSGTYTKIGQLIVLRFNIALSSKGSATGGAAIGGLPLTMVTGLAGLLLSAANMSSWATPSFDPQTGGFANINLTTTTGTAQASNSNFTNTSALFGSIMHTST